MMRLLAPILWSATGASAFAGGVLLLIGCDFRTPRAFSFGGAFCPARIDLSALIRERDRREDLEGKIHEAQLALAGMPDCPPKPKVETEGDKARKRAQERGGKSGRLQITLSWRTKDDLDLEVRCSAEDWIGFLAQATYKNLPGKGQCGDGRIDVDANRKMINPVTDPVENAVWDANIPQFMVVYVRPFIRGSTAPIDYLVSFKFDDEERLCKGTINSNDAWGRVMYFRPKHPMPPCVDERDQYRTCTEKTECDFGPTK
jgi:hypothetical protein